MIVSERHWRAWSGVREWLRDEHGLGYFTVAFTGEDPAVVLDWMCENNPGIYYLLTGSSGENDHVVVAFEDRIVHDPGGITSPESLVGPDGDGYFWVGVLVSANLT